MAKKSKEYLKMQEELEILNEKVFRQKESPTNASDEAMVLEMTKKLDGTNEPDNAINFDSIIPQAQVESKQIEKSKSDKKTQSETLLGIIKVKNLSFFHCQIKNLYAEIPIENHKEVWSLSREDFKIWLSNIFYKETEKTIGDDAIKQTLRVLSAKSRFEGEEIALSTRVAEYERAIWYDLTNSVWQAVKIASDGWGIVNNPPILFNRYRHQKSQLIPVPGGDIRKIFNYVNVKKEEEILFLCCLVSYFIPNIPKPIIIFYGEKGSGKSTKCSFVKEIVDPSILDTQTLQNDLRTLAINLQQHWFLAFDNVSYINEDTSDTLCRAITGGGIQQRKLHTNDDDTIFTFKRCIAINGINCVATRADLLDRSVLIELERIAETDRKELTKIQSDFENDRPEILGGIFDTLVKAMQIHPTVELDRLPRMADFTRWGYAIGEALGGFGQGFLNEYAKNRDSQNDEAINSDPVATLIVAFMGNLKGYRTEDMPPNSWEGEPSALYTLLVGLAPKHGINPKLNSFPKDPTRLSKRIKGMTSNLEMVGIAWRSGRIARQRTITLSKTVKWDKLDE